MRAYEFLNEEIDLSHLYPDIIKTIQNSIIKDIEHVKSMKSFSIKYKNEVNETGSIAVIPYIMNTFDSRFIDNDLRDKFKDAAGPNSLTSVYVSNISAKGAANFSTIYLNKEYITKMGRQIFNTWYNYVLDSLPSEDALFDTFFDAPLNKYIIEDILQEISDFVRNIASTFLHELVHIAQHHKQKHREVGPSGLPKTQYYSYLDNPKVRNAIEGELQQLNKEYKYSPRFLELHSSSPQEIAANANQTAVNIAIEWGLFEKYFNIEDLTPEMVADMGKTIPSHVKNYLVPASSDPNIRRIEEKVHKRYIKIIYKILQTIVADIKNKASKESKQNSLI